MRSIIGIVMLLVFCVAAAPAQEVQPGDIVPL
jgi:hypothetical protein